MNVSLQSLIGKLNEQCRCALEAAAGLCLTRTNYEVDIEHMLLKLLDLADTDLAAILRRCEIDASRLIRDLTRALDRLKTGNARTPALSPHIARLIQDAWLIASVDYGASRIRSGHLLTALLNSDDLVRLAREISNEFTAISPESLKRDLPKVTAGTAEDKAEPAKPGATTPTPGQPLAGAGTRALDQFTIDLTARAQAGQIDPVLGRDF